MEERKEMRWGGWMKQWRRKAESGWRQDGSEIRVLVFYSLSDCWGVKCGAGVAVWSCSSWKARAAAAVTCYCWLQTGAYLWGTDSLFFPKRAKSCWVMSLDWYWRVGVTQFKPLCWICGSINTVSHLRPEMDCVCNNYTFSEHKQLRGL